MQNYQTINEALVSREPCTSFEDNTYYTEELFEHFCNNRDYKYVTIFGYYKNKYNWTDAQALEMYNKSPDGWTDGLGIYRSYDWGRGENKIITGNDKDWHEPHLDHIIPRSKGGQDIPDNFQVLPRKINVIMSNLTDEEAPAIFPVLLQQFPGVVLDKK
jgi:hypothetical protein